MDQFNTLSPVSFRPAVQPSAEAARDIHTQAVAQTRDRRAVDAIEKKTMPALVEATDARLALEDPPPLPHQAQQALADVNEETVQQFEVLVIESQGAIERGLQTSSTERSAKTRTERLVASMGPVSQLQGEQLNTQFLMLAAHGPNGARDALSALLEVQDAQVEASLARQRDMQAQANDHAARARLWQRRLSPVMTGAKLISAVATIALMSTAAPAGLALAGLGAALGAGGALAMRREDLGQSRQETAWVAVQGALLGATLVGGLGAPLLAVCRGASPWMALGIGCQYVAGRESLVGWELGARATLVVLQMGLAGSQFGLNRQALDLRNAEACLRVEQVSQDSLQKTRDQVRDGLTQVAKRRHHSLNQAQQLLSKRHRTVVGIQARMRH